MRKNIFNEHNIVLIGMMGSGKTTIGELLAEAIGLTFVDADEELERWTGRKISDIFATDGEETFRKLEIETVKRLAQRSGQVIATGGGVILHQENVIRLKEKGLIIFLNASSEVLYRRLQDDISRPLLQVQDLKERIHQLQSQRLGLYQEVADWELDTSNDEIEQIVEYLMAKIEILINRQR